MRKYIFFLRIYKKCILRFTWQYFHNLFEDESREQSMRFGAPYKAFALSGREGNGRGVRGMAGMREGKCNSNQAHEDYQAKVQTMLGKMAQSLHKIGGTRQFESELSLRSLAQSL